MILLDRVTKFYPGDSRPALDHVSLHIEPNEFVFLVGKSGAGKSTLMKMITKEESPDKGKIIIGGIDLDYVKKRYVPHYRRRLGVVFQDFKLLPGRTVYENVAFALEIAGMSNAEIEKTVPKVLDLVGLAGKAKKFPRHLSGGEQQRVSIARSVARQPKILIADEPTGNLDKLTRSEIIDLLQKINDFGTTVLVTTHDENIVNNLQKRVITLKDGQIVSDQKIRGVYRLDKAIDKKPLHPTLDLRDYKSPQIVRNSELLHPTPSRPVTPATSASLRPMASLQQTTVPLRSTVQSQQTATVRRATAPQPTAVPRPIAATPPQTQRVSQTQKKQILRPRLVRRQSNLVVDSAKLTPNANLNAPSRIMRSPRKVI